MNSAKNSLDRIISLRDIAEWSENSQVTIPALQRGLVWKPDQIELLWDSLMRGIPVGALVICKRIDSQSKEILNKEPDKEYYHLLDGQQRVNAIQLGFDDFDNSKDSRRSILWLDLSPEISSNSTRNYLFRVTTTAHPWGYQANDSADRLSASKVRNGLKEYHELDPWKEDGKYQRPLPQNTLPFEARFPVPMSIVWTAYDGEKERFKDNIKNILEQKYSSHKWAKKILDGINNGELSNFEYITKGLKIAAETKIIALKTPDNLLTETKQEQNQQNEDKTNITAIEHLFQRLNQQGTELNGEELAFSMIKAYWPEVRIGIENIETENKLMPASRLVSLAVRAILSEKKGENSEKEKKIVPPRSVSDIRKLAKNDSAEDIREEIKTFINDAKSPDSLFNCCREIDVILGVKPDKNWGLPPVLRSSIAYDMPELYLFLILLTRKFKKNNKSISEDVAKALTGIVTWLKWFGDKNLEVNYIISDIYYNVDINNFSVEILKEKIQGYMPTIHKPEDLELFLKLPEENIANWRFWTLFSDSNEERRIKWECFLNNLKWNRELLLYAQREYLKARFGDFDPARRDLWENHNRPWDYDHIFAKKYAHDVRSNNDFLFFCKEWRDSNGNMRAWPFEANRSAHAIVAKDKIKEEKNIRDSFIASSEMDGFSVGNDAVQKADAALAFAGSCRSRMIRIYREWFENLEIGKLLS